MFIEEKGKVSYDTFQKMMEDLGDKKLSELNREDICKYMLLVEELDWMDSNIGDDAQIWYTYDDKLLDELSNKMSSSIFTLINEELLYDYDLHTGMEKDEDYEV